MPWSSTASIAGSPARVLSRDDVYALATTFPHVKHRTGVILAPPVRLLPLLPRSAAQGVLRELSPRVRHDEGAVVLPEHRLELLVVEVLHEPARDRRAGRVRLGHAAPAPPGACPAPPPLSVSRSRRRPSW